METKFTMETTNQSSNKYLAYVRVSTKDQSRGTSLEEQRGYIERYAKNKGIVIKGFYEEVESASRIGRHIFDQMIHQLKNEKLGGIIFHKVDRSARNPRDQAMLYDLMQEKYELHFVAEGLSTNDPVGRNMLYMSWGMASAYTENLKAEINKGITGRLKQGRLPGGAPVGYKKAEDCRSVIDEAKAPFIKQIFREYATGRYSIVDLTKYANKIGLHTRYGNPFNKNSLHRILRDSFYYGLIDHKRGLFQGEHEPLISKSLFDKVQFILKEKGFKRDYRFSYVFRGLLNCPSCNSKLKAMTAKKKWKYYYCRNRECSIKTFSESSLEEQLIINLQRLEFTDEEMNGFKRALIAFRQTTEKSKEDQIKALNLEMANIEARLTSLLQKFIDQKIDDETYSKAREAYLNRKYELIERRSSLEKADEKAFAQMNELGKLLKNPVLAYKNADEVNKRRLIISMMENLKIKDENLLIVWKKPFDIVAKRPIPENGSPSGNRTRVAALKARRPNH